MQALARMYHPITGTPFQHDETYQEVAPCAALAPYIRCFWGSAHPVPAQPGPEGIVIPDTCMDVIFHTDYDRNRTSSSFCALDDTSNLTSATNHSGGLETTFAIRFYAWTACLFVEDDLRGSLGVRCPAEQFFPRLVRVMEPLLFDEPTLQGRIRIAESVLLSLLNPHRMDTDVLNAIHHMLRTSGRARISDVSAALAMSSRQLERRFDACMGASPKTIASLLRYQLLWQEIVRTPDFRVLDAVDRFGYTDQAHLLHDFHRRHLMSPREAIAFARR